MSPIDGILISASLILQTLVLLTILGGPWREYLSLVLYCSFLVFNTLADVTMLLIMGIDSVEYFKYIWIAEFVRQTCQLAFVLTLAAKALPAGKARTTGLRLLLTAAMVIWAGSLVICYNPRLGEWLNKVIRNISFMSALIDLVLWFALVASSRRDVRLLMISGGLGIQMTGDAIGQSLKQFTLTAGVADFVNAGCFLLCLFIWLQAFRERRQRPVERNA